MMQFLSQLMKLPLEAFVFSMEMLVKSMQGLQSIAYQGIDTIVGGAFQTSGHRPGSQSDLTNDVIDGTIQDSAEPMSQTTQEGEKAMAEMDLRDRDHDRDEDYLKLVRYKILFVKRDYEHAFDEMEELVTEEMDAAAYTAWKVAEFIQRLQHERDEKKVVKVPDKWKDYPPHEPRYRVGDNLKGFPDEDKKYLRVYFQVLERYRREPFKYQEQQIEVLKEIRDRMPPRQPPQSSISS
jgi:hypothetical protein